MTKRRIKLRTLSAGRVKGGVSWREFRALGNPNHVQNDTQNEGDDQYPRTEPAHGVEVLQIEGKERHRIIMDEGEEQLAVSPHKIRHNPQELHQVVYVVDQAALNAVRENNARAENWEAMTLTCAVCQTKSSATSTVGTENTIHGTLQLWFQLVSFASQKKMWTFS